MAAWLKLLRLPNVFTAAADVMMGYLVTRGRLEPVEHVSLLVAASCLLYLGGIVLNDVFDADVDTRERPGRPIPSGAISLQSARIVGWLLIAGGVLLAGLISIRTRIYQPAAVATLLAVAIVLYDLVLKRTPLAPLLMGACRSLNVLLGMSLGTFTTVVPSVRFLDMRTRDAALGGLYLHELLIAAGVGIYIVGVTIFARTEARESSRARLVAGVAVLLAGLALLASVPLVTQQQPRLEVPITGWWLLWGALALITGRRCVMAILQPEPKRVQAAVRHCVHSIIVVDAAVCVGYAGPFWGFVVLALIFPTVLLTMWLDAT